MVEEPGIAQPLAAAAYQQRVSNALPQWVALLFISGALIAALVWQAYHIGITADEPSHLVSASLYWKGKDILLPRDMPPLIKIMAGLAPPTTQIPIPYHKQAWKQRSEWQVGMEVMLNLTKPAIQPLFFQARLPMIVFPLLTTWIVFLWGRALFSPLAGIAAAFLFAFEPTSLAHGALVKNDHAATFGYVLFWFAAWRYWKHPAWFEFTVVVLATALAVMAKLSLLILLLIAPALIVIREWTFGSSRRLVCARPVLLLLAVYAVMLATSWFDIRVLHVSDFNQLAKRNFPGWLPMVAAPFRFIPMPFLYWEGVLSLLSSHSDGSPVYLFGRVFPHGTPLYFLIAFALKAPLALQILLLVGLVSLGIAVSSRRVPWRDAAFLLLPLLLYIGCASLVSMQLGFRLILPALPFAALLCVSLFLLCRTWQRTIPFLLLVSAVGVTTARNIDTLIGYYNEWAGSREWATYYLANSNVDWGQDLPALNRWYRQTKPGRIRLFYFGMDNSDRFFTENELERMPTPWNMELIKGNRYQPESGYYAVSVNQLRGQFFPEGYRDYLAAFRAMRPVDYAGASIFIYRVP